MNPNWTPPCDVTDGCIPHSSDSVATITQKLKSSILTAAQKQYDRKAVFKQTLQVKKTSDEVGENCGSGNVKESLRVKSKTHQQIEVDSGVNIALDELQQLEKQGKNNYKVSKGL